MATIHIIEDDRDLLEILGSQFTARGFKVIRDFNGEQFAEGHTHNADLYLIDIALVGRSGLDISRQIKSGQLQKPVILMSGNFHKHSDIHEAEADAFIQKPFQLNEMVEQVRAMLPA